MKKILLTTLIVASLMGCSNEKETDVASQEVLLSQADAFLKDENYYRASTYLEALNTRFPRIASSQQTTLNLIYAYYQNGDYEKAINTAEYYFKNYGQSYGDYVLFMSGLSREMQNKNFFQDLFGRDPANRDRTSMKYALDNFLALVKTYPKSQYSQQAYERIRYIHSLLARYDLNVAKFYAKRDAWVAVANRLEELRKTYPDSRQAYECLPLLKEAYAKLQIKRLENDVGMIMARNAGRYFPNIKKPTQPKNIQPPKVVY